MKERDFIKNFESLESRIDAFEARIGGVPLSGKPLYEANNTLRGFYTDLELLCDELVNACPSLDSNDDTGPPTGKNGTKKNGDGNVSDNERSEDTQNKKMKNNNNNNNNNDDSQRNNGGGGATEKNKKTKTDSNTDISVDAATALRERGDRLRSRLNLLVSPASSGAPFPVRVIRVLSAAAFILLTAPVTFLLTLTRPAHPLLRALGLRNNTLPLDVYQRMLCRAIIRLLGISVVIEEGPCKRTSRASTKGSGSLDEEGLGKVDGVNAGGDVCGCHKCSARRGASVGFFTHGSNLDPPIVAAASLVTFRWIGKTSAFFIPVLGQFAWALGMIPIDRSNRDKAIASLGAAAKSILRWDRSIAIAPEGRRSRTGQILPFKKGPFYLAEESGAEISPVVVYGAYELWPPTSKLPTPGQVVVRFLNRRPLFETGTAAPSAENRKNHRDDLMRKTRAMFLREMKNSPSPNMFTDKSKQSLSIVADYAFIAVSASLSWMAFESLFSYF